LLDDTYFFGHFINDVEMFDPQKINQVAVLNRCTVKFIAVSV
jgi:hypothetical protein